MRRRRAGHHLVQGRRWIAVLAVTAVTAGGAGATTAVDPLNAEATAPREDLAALGARVLSDCIAAGDTAESCGCMVDGLIDRLPADDVRRFFLLTLDEPATGLPMLSLEEVDRFTQRLEDAMAAIAPACNR